MEVFNLRAGDVLRAEIGGMPFSAALPVDQKPAQPTMVALMGERPPAGEYALQMSVMRAGERLVVKELAGAIVRFEGADEGDGVDGKRPRVWLYVLLGVGLFVLVVAICVSIWVVVVKRRRGMNEDWQLGGEEVDEGVFRVARDVYGRGSVGGVENVV